NATGGLRVHTTLPSPKPHAILAGRDKAGAASASGTAFLASRLSAVTTGQRQSGHSGRSSSHLPMHSSWNPWPQPGSTRTSTADGSESPEHPAAPASSDRHTAHSWGAAAAATALVASSGRSPRDDAKARIPAVAAAATPATTAPAIAIMESFCASACVDR
uniref:Uncharacterized protein n=1 Tax=Triticum urartu TaxID=4572 RepID=A0A8R7TJV0_TRIUA